MSTPLLTASAGQEANSQSNALTLDYGTFPHRNGSSEITPALDTHDMGADGNDGDNCGGC